MPSEPTRVRTATIADARAISSVQVATWRAAYADLMPETLLSRMDVETNARRRAEAWEARHADARVVDLVAERGGGVVGWASIGPTDQDDLPGHGQLFALYALGRAWGSGVGHALAIEAEVRLRRAGFARACLFVLDGNDRAARFYERHGWREDGRTWIDERFGVDDVPVPLLERRRVRDLHEEVTP